MQVITIPEVYHRVLPTDNGVFDQYLAFLHSPFYYSLVMCYISQAKKSIICNFTPLFIPVYRLVSDDDYNNNTNDNNNNNNNL